jgi:5-formyltetrahydrofolate cyclo-ligase
VQQSAESEVAARKQAIRESVWQRLDADNISTFPRPVRGRIPNVRNADSAAERLAQTPEWVVSQDGCKSTGC